MLCLLIEKIKHRYLFATCSLQPPYISLVSIFVSRKINISRELEKSYSYRMLKRMFSKNLDWRRALEGKSFKTFSTKFFLPSFVQIFVFIRIFIHQIVILTNGKKFYIIILSLSLFFSFNLVYI